jgi:hypothetical protein
MATALILKAYIGIPLAKFGGGAYNGNKIMYYLYYLQDISCRKRFLTGTLPRWAGGY